MNKARKNHFIFAVVIVGLVFSGVSLVPADRKGTSECVQDCNASPIFEGCRDECRAANTACRAACTAECSELPGNPNQGNSPAARCFEECNLACDAAEPACDASCTLIKEECKSTCQPKDLESPSEPQ